MASSTFQVNTGSDLTFSIPWPDGAGGNANLTGYTLNIIDVHPSLVGLVSATSTDLSVGAVDVRVEWADASPVKTLLHFRVQVSLGTEQQSTNRLKVYYK